MANIKSAEKRISVINKKTIVNRRIKEGYRSVIKAFDKAIASKDLEAAKEKLDLAEKKLKKAAAHGTVHKNMASRKVSRMTIAYNKAKAEAEQ